LAVLFLKKWFSLKEVARPWIFACDSFIFVLFSSFYTYVLPFSVNLR
jgi:hypothetical protein